MELANISGLKCDNCTYADKSIQLEEYINYINAPCSECGESLLTQEDYEQVQQILSIYGNPTKNIKGENDIEVKGNMNGSGNIDFDIID